MKVIVGLGNPGDKYEKTRHNMGFLVADALIEKLEPLKQTFWEEEKSFKALVKQVKNGADTLLLVKPSTFMNGSGVAVGKILSYYKVEPQDLIVIYDELDLPFGKIRIRFGGGAGGHHGVESIIEALGSDKFLRIRLGIGNPRRIDGKEIKSRNHQNVDKYVLGELSSGDRGKVKTMIKQAVRDVELVLSHGIETYMSKYNK